MTDTQGERRSTDSSEVKPLSIACFVAISKATHTGAAVDAVFDVLRSKGVPIDALEHGEMEACAFVDHAKMHWIIVPDEPTGEVS